jgi:hypothetical protein
MVLIARLLYTGCRMCNGRATMVHATISCNFPGQKRHQIGRLTFAYCRKARILEGDKRPYKQEVTRSSRVPTTVRGVGKVVGAGADARIAHSGPQITQ